MRIVACRACGAGVAIDDPACPACGAAPSRAARGSAILILMLVAFGVSVSGVLIPLLL